MTAMTVENLSKTYRYHQREPGPGGSVRSRLRRQRLERMAVDRVTFSIDLGEIVGFLGPNGAGKTTTLKMLCGLLFPTTGAVRVGGFDVQAEGDRARQLISYVPD